MYNRHTSISTLAHTFQIKKKIGIIGPKKGLISGPMISK